MFFCLLKIYSKCLHQTSYRMIKLISCSILCVRGWSVLYCITSPSPGQTSSKSQLLYLEQNTDYMVTSFVWKTQNSFHPSPRQPVSTRPWPHNQYSGQASLSPVFCDLSRKLLLEPLKLLRLSWLQSGHTKHCFVTKAAWNPQREDLRSLVKIYSRGESYKCLLKY